MRVLLGDGAVPSLDDRFRSTHESVEQTTSANQPAGSLAEWWVEWELAIDRAPPVDGLAHGQQRIHIEILGEQVGTSVSVTTEGWATSSKGCANFDGLHVQQISSPLVQPAAQAVVGPPAGACREGALCHRCGAANASINSSPSAAIIGHSGFLRSHCMNLGLLPVVV